MEETIQPVTPNNPQPKKKKKHTALKVILILLLVLIVLPIGLIYALFFDGTSKKVTNSTVNMTEVAKQMVTDGLSYASDETAPKISLQLQENLFSSLIYTALQKLPSQATQFLPASYVEIGNTFDLYVEAAVPNFAIFKTRALVSLSLTHSDDNQIVYLNIANVKLGRVGGWQEIPQLRDWLANTLGSSLTSAFTSAGLHITSDLGNLRFIYPTADLISDVKTMMGEGTNALLFNMLDEFAAEDLMNIGLGSGAICVDFNLKKLITNEYVNADYDEAPLSENTSLATAVAALKTKLDSGEIDATDDDAMSTFVQDTYASYFTDTADVTSSYLQDTIKNNAHSALTTSGFTGRIDGYTSISETEMNKYLHDSSIIGQTYIFTYKQADETYKVSYVTIDNVYSDIYSDSLFLNIKLNINGCRTTISCIADIAAGEGLAVNMTISEMKFGELAITGELETTLHDFIKDAFGTGETISAKEVGDDLVIVFSFDSFQDEICNVVAGQTGVELSANQYTFDDPTVTGTSQGDIGTIKLSFSASYSVR